MLYARLFFSFSSEKTSKEETDRSAATDREKENKNESSSRAVGFRAKEISRPLACLCNVLYNACLDKPTPPIACELRGDLAPLL